MHIIEEEIVSSDVLMQICEAYEEGVGQGMEGASNYVWDVSEQPHVVQARLLGIKVGTKKAFELSFNPRPLKVDETKTKFGMYGVRESETNHVVCYAREQDVAKGIAYVLSGAYENNH